MRVPNEAQCSEVGTFTEIDLRFFSGFFYCMYVCPGLSQLNHCQVEIWVKLLIVKPVKIDTKNVITQST